MEHLEYSETASRLRVIFNTVIDGIITIDASGIIESMNPAAAQLFGYKPEEVIGHNVKCLMGKPHRQQHDGYLSNYHNTGVRKIIGIGREVQGRRKDGTLFPFFLSVSEVLLADKKIFTAIIHDISDLKKAQEQIIRLNKHLEKRVAERTEELAQVVDKLLIANKRLETEIQERIAAETALIESEQEIRKAYEKEKQLNELKSRFVSMASHEFRTPLSTILSSAALIARYTKSDQQAQRTKHIQRIKKAVKTLTHILNDFLSLSKLEEGKVLNRPQWFCIKDFAGNLLEALEGLAKKEQEIIYQHHGTNSQIFLDENILRNICLNLLSNAIKYSKQDGIIHFKTSFLENTLKIIIQDQGIGIPKEEVQYLFTRFFRAKNVSNIQGTGLGLNIVKRYTDLLNGTIELDSEEGVGTKVAICIPIVPQLSNEKND